MPLAAGPARVRGILGVPGGWRASPGTRAPSRLWTSRGEMMLHLYAQPTSDLLCFMFCSMNCRRPVIYLFGVVASRVLWFKLKSFRSPFVLKSAPRNAIYAVWPQRPKVAAQHQLFRQSAHHCGLASIYPSQARYCPLYSAVVLGCLQLTPFLNHYRLLSYRSSEILFNFTTIYNFNAHEIRFFINKY